MRTYNLFIILVIITAIFSCKPEVIPEPEEGWIGTWKISQVDSAYLIRWMDDSISVVEEIPITGYIHFYKDSTGLFEVPIRFNCNRPEFSWSHYNGAEDTLHLNYAGSGTGELIIALEFTDHKLVFRKPTCFGSPGMGSTALYRFHSTKE